VISGNVVKGTITFTGPAPFEGMTVYVDNNHGYFESYRVRPMQSSIPVIMSSPMVSSTQTLIYTAQLRVTNKLEKPVEIDPASAVENISLAQTTVSSCSADLVWGTVSLDGWLGSSSPSVQVTLTSDHPELVSFERQPADGGGPIDPFFIGQLHRDGYFCVRCRPATDDTVVVITATAGGVSRSCGLLIEAAGLQGFSVFPNLAVAGTQPGLSIQMCTAVNVTIALSSSDPNVASVPPTVRFSTNGWFNNWSVRLHPVDRPTTVTLFASYKDKIKTTQLTVVPPLPPAYSVQEFLVGRIGSAEARLSAAEAAVNELTARAAMHERLSESDIAAARERLARLEKTSVTPEYVDKRTAALEADAGRIRTLEGQLAEADKRIEKLEAAAQALLAEQARAAENEKDSGAALEELRAQFASMSVLFNHLRGSGLAR
ncbi:MAG: hypothetical protein NTY45_01375, partial [Elusimicrobia bacterium]|nr:hypothetical protein [Elusimicrobiota bacterium]